MSLVNENQLRGALMDTKEGKGALGFKGERGYSAYEIAVQNGYEGTEQQWIEHFGLDLSGYVQTSDVVDNLTSTETTHPLSAKQGKNLKDTCDTLNSSLTTLNNNYEDSVDYSTTETVIGIWLDKPLYRKVINFGGLPNNTYKSVAHNISDISKIIRATGYSYATSGSFVNIPYSASGTNSIELVANVTDITIYTHTNQTAFSECYIVVEYTKTTD